MPFEETPRRPLRPGGTTVRLTGRPKRQKVIQKEDLLDLRIALETTKSVEEFIRRLP